jgi:hypothetical protein
MILDLPDLDFWDLVDLAWDKYKDSDEFEE